jgi:polyhydroxyalkanoate synthesis repressor PhaR
VVTQRSTDGPDPVVIRKYPNRRLYDTGAKRYVNLEEIAALIRQGREVQVVDSRTGEDLTRVVLTQIITEDAKDQPAGLPIELLRQLVMATDHARQELLGWYLRSAFDAYHKVQEAVQSRLEDVRSAALSPLGVVRNLFSGGPSSEIDYLRRRVAELEERLVEMQAASLASGKPLANARGSEAGSRDRKRGRGARMAKKGKSQQS